MLKKDMIYLQWLSDEKQSMIFQMLMSVEEQSRVYSLRCHLHYGYNLYRS